MRHQLVETVFDAFEFVDADVVEFLDRNGKEIPDEQLDDNFKVLAVRNFDGMCAEVDVDYIVK